MPFEDPAAAAAAVRRLHEDVPLRGALAWSGRQAALRHYSWDVDGKAFVAQIEAWAAGPAA
ncbi:MAG: hypothetical protein M3P93_10575 [Actinomycetota bacterium]|nr:hypothetical protein [Actinomycetota bacterium]